MTQASDVGFMTSYQESDAASRRDENHSALGCLIPLIATTVILATAITLFSWLVLSDDEEEAQDADQEVSADAQPPEERIGDEPGGLTDDVEQVIDDLSPASASVSTEALLEVVRSGMWQEFGQPEVYDLGSQSRVHRKFRRQGDQQIRLTLHTFKSSSATRSVLEQTDLPARAIQFHNKVVVIEPLSGDASQSVEPLAQRLRRFRDLLEERDDSE